MKTKFSTTSFSAKSPCLVVTIISELELKVIRAESVPFSNASKALSFD